MSNSPSSRFGMVLFYLFITMTVGFGIRKWRYVVYGPQWLIRAHWADHSNLYAGKTNDIPNLDLIQQARSYISDVSIADASGNFSWPEALRTEGVRVSANWFKRHHPESVDFNPFVPASRGNFAVTWLYAPGCQRLIRNSFKTDTDWYDPQGQPCFGVCFLTVRMDSHMRLTDINLHPLKAL